MKWMLTALGGLRGAIGAISWFPGTWPFAGAISAVASAIGAFIRTVFEGLTRIVSNPLTLVAASTVAAFTFLYGIHTGIKIDGRRASQAVAACNIRVSQIESEINRKVEAGVETARKAEDGLGPLPEDLAEACRKSASCRSRNSL